MVRLALRPRLPIQAFFNQTFAALRHRNYRLWFTGQLVSLFGTWMQSTAQLFLVFELTHSTAYLGYVGFAAGLPSWLFTLYGGAVADRISRRRLLLITQSSMMVLAFILSALTFARLVQPWHIIVLAFFLGVANAFDAPARLAIIPELIERDDLTNAIALNATMFNTATVLGPAFAGLTYELFGPAFCFLINGLSFTAVILALLLMRLAPFARPPKFNSVFQDVKAGLRFVASHPVIRILIINLAVVSLAGLGFITLMPAWAVKVMGGDAQTNGLLLSARGFGALAGALAIASLGRIRFKGKLLTLGTFAMPLMLLVFSFTRVLPVSLGVLVLVGLSFMILMNMSNALVQTHAPDELRGRVMGIYTLTFFGIMPLGSLLNGTLATRIGEPLTVTINAIFMLAFSTVIFLLVPRVRALE
jgi:MFS family permease